VSRRSPRDGAAMSLEQIADVEGISVDAAHMLPSGALHKLRRQGLLIACKELSNHLNANRSAENIVRRTARGR
jgi:hypothetical protein